jgi:hypothetical protein
MTPLIHNYSNLAGKTVHWDTADSQQKFETNLSDPDKKQRLIDLGYLDRPIIYQFNSHGFRGVEFETPVDVVCFGCSYTMGTGVNAEHTWPSQLAELTGMRVINLGHAGSSNDTAFRFANYYLERLRPRWAIWLQTDMHRLELLDESINTSMNILATDTKNPCANDYFIKIWFSTVMNQQLNLEKNTMAFRYLCDSLQIKHITMPRSCVVSDKCGRDLSHPGPDIYQQLARRVVEQLG